MPTLEEIKSWPGAELHSSDGDKIGKLDHVYLDRETGEPTFGAVKTGLFGSSSSLVPIDDARRDGDDVVVNYTKDQVKDAPNVTADGELSEEEEQQLYRHYAREHSHYEGEDFDRRDAGAGTTAAAGTTATGTVDRDRDRDVVGTERGVGHDTSGPNTDDAMTRSEEELRVGTERREAGRARLRKVVVTEDVHTTVPVSHEEVRIEREPITDANRGDAHAGADITEEEHEVTLHEERPVVQKETVAKERVRLGTETVTEEAAVDETVRKEQIEADGVETDVDRPGPGR